jgi:hypothetical protein
VPADFTHYPGLSTADLTTQLAVVVSELFNAYHEVGSTQASERQARVQGFLRSTETSVAGRERDAEAQSMHLTVTLYELQGRIKALTEERDLLRLLLDDRK